MASKSTNSILLWLGSVIGGGILLGSLLGWLPFDNFEVFGIVTGIVCVVLAVRENIWNFPVGIINSFCMAVLFYKTHLYGVMTLQVIFLLLGIHGWYYWKRGKNQAPLRVSRLRFREAVVLTLVAIPLIWVLTRYLGHIQDPAPLPDAVVVVTSMIAQYLLNLKRAENWALGVGIDVVNVGIYVSQGLWLTSGLYLFYLVMCALGYREWLAIYREQQAAALISQVEDPADVSPVGRQL